MKPKKEIRLPDERPRNPHRAGKSAAHQRLAGAPRRPKGETQSKRRPVDRPDEA